MNLCVPLTKQNNPMILNPFDKQLESARQTASELSSSLTKIRQELEWFEGTSLDTLIDHREQLRLDSETQLHDCDLVRDEVERLKTNINDLSQSISSLWNPKNWFDSKQRDLRAQAAKLKGSLDRAKENHSIAQGRLQDIECRTRGKIEEIARYEAFDFDATNKKRSAVARQLSQQKKQVEVCARRKQQVDTALEPIVSQIRDAERKKSEATSGKQRAQELDDDLSGASNSYERAMTHQACEELFGTGSPRKVISQKDAEIRRLDRDLEKLQKRAGTIANKAARDVRKLVLDGNNLCYEDGTFLGLDAIRVLVAILADGYEVTVVFDASIRRALDSGDSEIRKVFGNSAKVHVVATGVKADETVLDIAGMDKTAFIISNDRFAEFSEKSAVRDQRVIRHEIVAGKVLINDLGVSETYRV